MALKQTGVGKILCFGPVSNKCICWFVCLYGWGGKVNKNWKESDGFEGSFLSSGNELTW